MNESPTTPEEDPRPESGSFYLYPLRLDDGTTTMQRVSREELLCMVSETIHQPKPGVRGPKPTPWRVAHQRLEQMRRARDAIRSQADGEVTKPGILEKIGHRGDRSTIDRWLKAVPISWEQFLAEGINATGTHQTREGQGPAPTN